MSPIFTTPQDLYDPGPFVCGMLLNGSPEFVGVCLGGALGLLIGFVLKALSYAL